MKNIFLHLYNIVLYSALVFDGYIIYQLVNSSNSPGTRAVVLFSAVYFAISMVLCLLNHFRGDEDKIRRYKISVLHFVVMYLVLTFSVTLFNKGYFRVYYIPALQLVKQYVQLYTESYIGLSGIAFFAVSSICKFWPLAGLYFVSEKTMNSPWLLVPLAAVLSLADAAAVLALSKGFIAFDAIFLNITGACICALVFGFVRGRINFLRK